MTAAPLLPLRTERLLLRRPRRADAAALAAYRSDPAVARYQSWQSRYPLGKAEALIAELADVDEPRDGEWFTIAVADATTDEMVGDVALRRSFAGRATEIGYTLRADHHGRGIASEAVRAVLDRLFTNHGLRRAYASMHPDNDRSGWLVERLGFSYEGTSRSGYWVGDGVTDDVHYGVLVNEWWAWQARDLTPPSDVTLVEVTPDNTRAVRKVMVHRTQEPLVSSVTTSLADALTPEVVDGAAVMPWYRAVVADGVVVGFVMMAERTERHPDPYLWRLLIDRWHQGRGIGTRVVAAAIEHACSQGATRLKVSWEPGPGTPDVFYRRLGFEPTGEIDDGEIVAALRLD
ncbi:hypothetical protein BH24ACT5_BH24ACT5_09580 [soil metagenome]